MGRTNTVARRTVEDYSELPTIYGGKGVIEFAARELGVSVTPTLVRRATEARRLQVFKISTRNVYSERGIYNWIMSMARGGAK
ncbi:hypothetical protein IU487_06515 [Nocardia puris]|uniref:hypothetical protein n=1 Tax=Nocardia puris TaxID=208602 RepID=UPI001894C5E2|nr:hypothetical protein [Nocardia puris]MBF6210701.1 hypothetical protein [Nocardia puris]